MFKYFNKRLLFISFTVYLCINLFENLFHYNIGKYSDHDIKMDIPTPKDWWKIITVMLFFALLQGIFTCLLDKRCN
jgi:hypothetical protein